MLDKINLLVDTNSLIHLSKIELGRGLNADEWVYEHFNVYQIEQIVKEYRRNIKKEATFNRKNPLKKKNNFKKRNLRKFQGYATYLDLKQLEIIEHTVVANYYKKTLGDDDRGERHLIASAIGAIYLRKFNYCIILTDDYTAFRKFLGKIKDDFKFGDVWNVFDIITYLFLIKKSMSVEFATNAIRTLCAFSSIPVKYFIEQHKQGITEFEARGKMGTFYVEKIQKNNALRRVL